MLTRPLARTRRLLAAGLVSCAALAGVGALHTSDALAYENCGSWANTPMWQTGNYLVDVTLWQNYQSALLCLVNNWREANGRVRLTYNYTLFSTAYRYSWDSVSHHHWDPDFHKDSAGKDPTQRNAAYEYGTWAVGETIAQSPPGSGSSPTSIWIQWLGSPKHNAIMLDPRYREAGVAVAPYSVWGAYGGAFYTMDYGVHG